jgi:hypothetical protein
MKKSIVALVVGMLLFTAGQVTAVELLHGGDFEWPGWYDAVGWERSEFLTGSGEAVNSAELVGDFVESQLWLRAHDCRGEFRQRRTAGGRR